MNNNIYYFSGTGNSKHLATELGRQTSNPVFSIPEVLKNINKHSFVDNLVIVFPSYLAMIYGVPVIVKDFVDIIPNIKSKKILAVCSCGGYELVNSLPSIKHLEFFIKKNGGKLYDYFSLRLPMNNCDYDHIPIPIERDEKVILRRSIQKIDYIARGINNPKRFSIRKVGNTLFNLLMKPMFIILKKITYKSMIELAKEPLDTHKSMEEIFRLTDRSITVDDNCNGCGKCVKVCPVDNIKLVNSKPVWLNKCEMCFACHEWCPQKAIHHWGRKKGIYYHHPSLNL